MRTQDEEKKEALFEATVKVVNEIKGIVAIDLQRGVVTTLCANAIILATGGAGRRAPSTPGRLGNPGPALPALRPAGHHPAQRLAASLPGGNLSPGRALARAGPGTAGHVPARGVAGG